MTKVKQTDAERADELRRLKQFAQRVKQARDKLGLSQNDLAVLLSVTPGAVAQWELGKNFVQHKTMDKLVQTLHVSKEWLSGDMTLDEIKVLQVFRKIRLESQQLAIALLEQLASKQTPAPTINTQAVTQPPKKDGKSDPVPPSEWSKLPPKGSGKSAPPHQRNNDRPDARAA